MTNRSPQKPDPDLLARLWHNLVLAWRLLLDGRVGALSKLIPVATVIYLLSPVDLIPDIFFPVGVLDDFGALLLGLQLFIRSAPPGVVQEYRRRMERGPRRGHFRPDETKIIDGTYEVRDDNEY